MNTREGGSLTVHTRAEIERNVFLEVKSRRGELDFGLPSTDVYRRSVQRVQNSVKIDQGTGESRVNDLARIKRGKQNK